jgi:peroxisomal 3,2-trans-enoyl-CoA isomerase
LRKELDSDSKVKLYAFYRQATAGPCNPPKPQNLDPVEESKWEAWDQLADMEKSLAEANYIRLSDKLWDREMNEGNHEESHLLTSNVDGIFTMTMNRPGKKNGLNFKMFRELILALDEATVDSSVRVVVWTGSGEWYSTGLDFTTLGVLANDPDRMDGWLDRSMANEFIDRLVCFPKPLVAAVNGPVRGIATTTLALCDLVYASEKVSNLDIVYRYL